jgi:uncharacterized protein
MLQKTILAFLLAMGWTDVAVAQASFDCRSARSLTEIAICSDAHLSELDRVGALGFDIARHRPGTHSLIKDTQILLLARIVCRSGKACILENQVEGLQLFQRWKIPITIPDWVPQYRAELAGTSGLPSPPLVQHLDRSRSAKSGEAVQGGCHMDICSWFRVEDRDTVQTNQLGSLVRIAIAIGESRHPNANYSLKTPIEWGQATTAYVFCSKAQPAIIFENDGKWEAATLSPGHSEGVFGYNELAYAEYLFVCHGLTTADPADASIAARFGYPAFLSEKIDQFELQRPEDIMTLR